MELWRETFRKGVAPCLSTAGLNAIKAGLETNDPALIQGATCCPPPMQSVLDWPVEGACPIGYAAWKCGAETVGEVEESFAHICFEADQLLGGPAAVRYWLNWYDDTPRDEMRKPMLEEVELALKERNGV